MSIDVEGLKARVDIVAVVGAYVALKKRGAEFVGLCPFHEDRNPSFWVSPTKGFCHCFACDAHHDVISFIQEKEGLDFKAACERLGAKTDWTPAAPLVHETRASVPERITSKPPPGVPTPSFHIRDLGEPELIFPIRDLDGGILGYECRYRGEGGKKEVRVWSWGQRGSRPAGWGCGHFNVPRPLYGLPRLREGERDAQVNIFEGPKKAEAGHRLLPGRPSISWTGGANAWHKHDWTPLRGRSVLIWPDADEPGWAAAEKLSALLADPKGLACRVRIVDSNRMPEGWDVADAEAEGWDSAKLIEWAKPRARDFTPPQNPAPPVAPVPSIGGSESVAVPAEPAAPGPSRNAQAPRKGPRLAVVDGTAALAPQAEPDALPAAMSEDFIADHFAHTHGARLRYVRDWGTWFEWRGDGWHRDRVALVDRLSVEITRQALYWPEAAALTTADAKRRLNSKRTASSVRDLAMSDRRIAATVDQWDRDPWLLGVPGGVVDLRTGKLQAARAEDYITKRTAVSPEPGDCPLWTGLLHRVTDGDDSLLGYLQRLCGYFLTGETREECFAFVYGPAQTGKSTFVRVLQEIMGEYHCKSQMDTFTETRSERHAEELAVLAGARLVTAVETEEGRRWNESRIKALTGRDRIRARFMRENSFEFDPQFKLLLAGNHAPHLRNVDDAMRRRLHIIPFTRPVPMEERDDQLAEKLRAEYPQILAWMVRGAIDWQAYKLGRPDQIAQAVDTYLESEDTFGEWISECATRGKDARCLSGGAYKNYKAWAEAAGEYSMSQKRFVQALKERGFDTIRSGGKRWISGLALRESDGPPFHDGRYPDD